MSDVQPLEGMAAEDAADLIYVLSRLGTCVVSMNHLDGYLYGKLISTQGFRPWRFARQMIEHIDSEIASSLA